MTSFEEFDGVCLGRKRRQALLSWVLIVLLSFQGTPAASADGSQRGGGKLETAIAGACSAELAPIQARKKAFEDQQRANRSAAGSEGLLKGMQVLAAGLLTNNNNSANGKVGTASLVAGSLLVAVSGSVAAYARIKQEQARNNVYKMSENIESDAAQQIVDGSATQKELAALATCRSRQVEDFTARFNLASNEKDRRPLLRERSALGKELQTEIDLTNSIVDKQANAAKALTQTRAMVEDKSEADILGKQKPAYAEVAATVPLKLPPTAPVQPTLVTLRSVEVHAEPNLTSGVVLTFPKGHSITPSGHAQKDITWWQVEASGATGYIRGVDLVEQGAPDVVGPTQGKNGRKGRKAASPKFAAPTNVRTLNEVVLTARETGPTKLKSMYDELPSGKN